MGSPVADANSSSTILIKEGTALPPQLSIESETFLPGWRIVKKPDRRALTRGIESAGWSFFYRAGGTRATVLGRDSLGGLRRAVKSVLARQEEKNFNSLEITRTVSTHFFGIPFLRVIAHSRHIQESSALAPGEIFVLRTSAGFARVSAPAVVVG